MNGSSMRFYLGTRTGTGSLGSFFFYGGDGTEIASINNTLIALGDNDDVEYVIGRRSHSDGAGGALAIKAGSATQGQSNQAGGNLDLYAGRSTGAINGGHINFYSNKRGVGGSNLGTSAILAAIKPATTATTFTLYENAGASTDDFYSVTVSAHGETLVATADNAGTAAHYKVDADGDITFNPATGVVRAGWHGSTTRIKILHSDFIADDGFRPVVIDDSGQTSEEFFLKTYSTLPAYVTVAIPAGYQATELMIYGSGTGAVEVWEHQINSKTGVSKGTGNVGTAITASTSPAFTAVTSSTTNYLLIQVAAGSDEIHGGYVTIAAV